MRHEITGTPSEFNEAGILPDDLTRTMRALAGLRNLLVHLYWKVDDNMIYAGIGTRLDDFEAFIACIVDFIENYTFAVFSRRWYGGT